MYVNVVMKYILEVCMVSKNIWDWFRPNYNVKQSDKLKIVSYKPGSWEQIGAMNEQNGVNMGSIPVIGGFYKQGTKAYNERERENKASLRQQGRQNEGNQRYGRYKRGNQGSSRTYQRYGAGAKHRYGEAYYRTPRNLPGNYAVSGLPSGWETIGRNARPYTGKRDAAYRRYGRARGKR